jgi:hypothetical protein
MLALLPDLSKPLHLQLHFHGTDGVCGLLAIWSMSSNSDIWRYVCICNHPKRCDWMFDNPHRNHQCAVPQWVLLTISGEFPIKRDCGTLVEAPLCSVGFLPSVSALAAIQDGGTFTLLLSFDKWQLVAHPVFLLSRLQLHL